jgi:hypothetical protein
MKIFTPRLFEYFWKHVDKKDDQATCWPWLGATGNGGYGKMNHDGQYFGANQVAWSSAHDGAAPSAPLSNTCGMRHCCNPAHWVERMPGDPKGVSKDITGDTQFNVVLSAEMTDFFDRQRARRNWSRTKMIKFALEFFSQQPIPMLEKTTICTKCRNGNHCGGGVIMEDLDVRWMCVCRECAMAIPATSALQS